MKKLFGFLFATVLLALSGCSPYTLTSSETYNEADLRDFSTFRIVTPDEGTLPPGMEMVTYYNIAAAIREQMVERGYTESPTSPMLINVALTVRKEIATAPLVQPMGPPPPAPIGPFYNGMYPWFMYPRVNYWPAYYSNAQVITGIYREGVLTMDIVDMQRKIPMYSSSVATIMDNGDSQFRNLEGIAKAVDVLFSKFPVPMLPQYKK